jgi:Zn-dependent peptidase ImmA (M78 family)
MMQQGRRQEINRLAEKIRSALELNEVPFPVEEAVKRLGGRVEIQTTSVDAFVKKEGDSFLVGLREQPETRRRFSVAHELGHLFLHMGYIIDLQKWGKIDEYKDSPKYRYGFTEEEYEAHEFAAALLMPTVEFRARVQGAIQNGQVRLAPIAEYFNVSIHAARVRGQWLGLFEWNQ